MNYKIVEQVSRKKKSMSGVLRVVMIIFAVLFGTNNESKDIEKILY